MKTGAGGRNQGLSQKERHPVADIVQDEHTVIIANGDLGPPLSGRRAMENDQDI
jgi:hypothetical protein